MSSPMMRLVAVFLLVGAAAACSDDEPAGGGGGNGNEADANELRTLDAPGPSSDAGGNDVNAPDTPISGEVCDNGTDDDNDTLFDCDDPDCNGAAECDGAGGVEDCDDQMDNDEDGRADCNDSDCNGDPHCEPVQPGTEICTDSQDNDDDGLVDCFDGDCGTDPACGVTTAEDCANGTDDDGDTAVDCDDADCTTFCDGGGIPGGNPDDFLCLFLCLLDPTSAGSFGCACGGGGMGGEVNCTDGLDDDSNGMIDCEDFACFIDPSCQ